MNVNANANVNVNIFFVGGPMVLVVRWIRSLVVELVVHVLKELLD